MPDTDKTLLRHGEDIASIRAIEAMPHFRLQRTVAPPTLGPICCLHFCTFTDQLVCGHTDGRVSVWHTFDDITPPEPVLVFQAHRGGGVTCMVSTQWGALWTGCTTGSLRLWPQAMADALTATGPPEGVAAVGGCEARRGSGERAHGRTSHVVLCAAGQVRTVPGCSLAKCLSASETTQTV